MWTIFVFPRPQNKQGTQLRDQSWSKHTLPSHGRRQLDGWPPPAAFCQLWTLCGDPGGGGQNDGWLPRSQRHWALHSVCNEYCKFGPAFLLCVCLQWVFYSFFKGTWEELEQHLADFVSFLLFWRSGCQTLPWCQSWKRCEHYCNPTDCSDRRSGEWCRSRSLTQK